MSAAKGQRASTGRGRQAGRKGALTGERDGGRHSRGRSSDTQGASRGSFWCGAVWRADPPMLTGLAQTAGHPGPDRAEPAPRPSRARPGPAWPLQGRVPRGRCLLAGSGSPRPSLPGGTSCRFPPVPGQRSEEVQRARGRVAPLGRWRRRPRSSETPPGLGGERSSSETPARAQEPPPASERHPRF